MDRVGIGPVKGLRIAVAAFILSVILFVSVVGVAFYLRNANIEEVNRFNQELRDGLVTSCERNGNPLREAVQSILREQIKNSSDPALLEQFFPQIPKEQLNQIIKSQIEADRQTLRKIEPLDCESLYPETN